MLARFSITVQEFLNNMAVRFYHKNFKGAIMKNLFFILSVFIVSHGALAQENYMISSSLWEGQTWSTNVQMGAWFPVIDTVAHFGIDNYSWGQVRTKATFPPGTLMQIDTRILLNSGGTNSNLAYFGFGDQWVFYTGKFYGVKFIGGEVHLFQTESSNDIDKGKIGTYTAGERITFTIALNANGSITVSGSKFSGSFTPSTPISTPLRVIMTDGNNQPNKGFLVSSVVKMPTNGLIAYYPFNGSANDESGNGNNGTVNGASLTTDQPGNANKAYSFTGGAGIILPNIFNLSTMTFCAWVNTTTGGYDRTIFNEYQNIPNTFKIGQGYRNDYVYAWMKVGTEIYVPKWVIGSSIGSAPLNQWNFVCVVIDAVKDTASIYVNGVLGGVAKMNGYTPKNLTSPANTGIGHSYDVTTDQYEGKIDDIRIYNFALSLSEIKSLYGSAAISVSASSLPVFDSVAVGTKSASKTYTVSGSNLSADIAVTAPTGFEVSTNNSTFSSSLTLTQTGGNVASTTIYARFRPASQITYVDSIANTSTGAATKYVGVRGNAIPAPGPSIKLTSVGSTVNPPTYPKGTEFWVEVNVGDPNVVTSLYGISCKLKSDNASCTYVDGSAIAMDFLGTSPLAFFHKIDNQTVDLAITKTSGLGVNGSGVVAKAKFITPANLPSDTVVNFSLTDITATNDLGGAILMNATPLTITIINTLIAVWPGDCNNDGVVSAGDLLPIGFYYGQKWQNFPTPNNPGMLWQAYLRIPWEGDIPPKKIYADANGDGIINSGDVLAIGLNYGRTHTVSAITVIPRAQKNNAANGNCININCIRTANNGLELELGGDFTSPVYGISLKLSHHFERNGICIPNTMTYFSSDTSGNILGKSIQFVRQAETNNQTDIAVSRIAGEGIIGSGRIAAFRYSLPTDWKAGDQLVVDASDVIANDSHGHAIPVNVSGYHGRTTSVKTCDILPTDAVLEQNYPNPFNPSTIIQYILPQPSHVRLEIFDILGRHVATLVNEGQNEGYHSVEWNVFNGTALSLSSGIYTYRLTVVNAVTKVTSMVCKRMIFNK